MTPIPGPRILGVGFSKTGTSTLGACFESLGLGPVCSPEVLHETFSVEGDENPTAAPVEAVSDDIASQRYRYFREYPWRAMCKEILEYGNYGLALHLAAEYRSFHDRPWSIGNMHKVIDAAYPDSKFVLTWREPEKWWRSVEHWLTVTHATDHEKTSRYLKHLGVERLEKNLFIDAYVARNEAIKVYFRDRNDLLLINFEEGDGWEKLCKFLDKPIPFIPFPHANKQTYLK